jgi:hypothetical protein
LLHEIDESRVVEGEDLGIARSAQEAAESTWRGPAGTGEKKPQAMVRRPSDRGTMRPYPSSSLLTSSRRKPRQTVAVFE